MSQSEYEKSMIEATQDLRQSLGRMSKFCDRMEGAVLPESLRDTIQDGSYLDPSPEEVPGIVRALCLAILGIASRLEDPQAK